MPTTSKCVCGHRWIVDDESAGSLGSESSVCPVCGALIDTLMTDSANANDAIVQTVDGSLQEQMPRGVPSTVPSIAGYDIRGILGSGGMGVVYRAFSSKLNRLVALKTLKYIDAVALHRFKREFRALTGVAHPNLVALYELVSDGQAWFFSMELVDGAGLLSYIRSGFADDHPNGESTGDVAFHIGTAEVQRIRTSFAQLASAVTALHRAGVLHRDIKPSNIMVTREGRVVLLDFGLVAELGESDAGLSTADQVVGTAAYMAPEQAAGQSVTEASDWYAVGVSLYQALTGRRPFMGSLVEVLYEKQNSLPPPPTDVAKNVPEDLSQLCVDLLQTDPSARPATEAILHRLNAMDTPGATREVAFSSTAAAVPLIGRDQHLEELDRSYWAIEQGQAVAVFVEGTSGMGKSALLKNFLDDVRQRRQAFVLTGRCYEQESVPFKALDSLIDSLCQHLRRLPKAEADGLMPRDIQALIRVFPVLGRVEAASQSSRRALHIADQQELRRRAVAALRELLSRLGDRHPLVLFVDDLQWGDVDSALMLYELLKPPDPPLLMFIGACRAEDAEGSPFLKAFRETQQHGAHPLTERRLSVGPLTEAQAKELALFLLDRQDSRAELQAEAIARESGGSPFFVWELVRYLQARDQTAAIGEIDLEEVLRFRLDRLPESAQRLLQAVAVAGKPAGPNVVVDAAGQETDDPALWSRLKAENLIRASGEGQAKQVEIYHDRFREAILGLMTPAERKDSHRRLANAIRSLLHVSIEDLVLPAGTEMPGTGPESRSIEQRDWQHIFDLAYHYDAAGDREQASIFALTAAERARGQHSLEIAEQQYRIAERGLREEDAGTRYRVLQGLGDVLMLRGRYEVAARYFHLVSPLAAGSSAKARIEGKLGELAFKQGDMKTASATLERGLLLLDKRTPRFAVAWYGLLAYEVVVQALHSMFPKWFVGKRSLEGAEDELLAARLFGRAGHAYWFESGAVATLATHLRGLNLAEKYPPTPELAQSYSEHAPGMSLVGLYRRGIEYAERSYRIREAAGDVWGQAQSLHFHGIVLYAASRFEECIERCRQAICLFDQTGDYWELNMARYQLAASLYRQGNFQEASDEAFKMHRSGLELGDAQASGLAVEILAKATLGHVPPGIIQAELSRPRGSDAQTASQVLQAEGRRLMAESRYAAAADAFRRGHETARRAGIKNTYVIPCLCWLATALRSEAERMQTQDPPAARKHLREAKRAAKSALRRARRSQNDLPHALREMGLLSATSGQLRRAHRYLDESLAVAEQQQARYARALTLLELGKLDQQAGRADGERRIAGARAEIADIVGAGSSP